MLALLSLTALASPVSDLIRQAKFSPCGGTPCKKPQLLYERIQASQPGYQWDDNGGCKGTKRLRTRARSAVTCAPHLLALRSLTLTSHPLILCS